MAATNSGNRVRSASHADKSNEAGRELGERVADMREVIQDRAGELAEAVVDGAGDVWEGLRDMGSGVRSRAADSVETVKDTAAGYFHDGQEQAQAFGAALERKIRKQPLASILLAVSVGFLAGAFLRRR